MAGYDSARCKAYTQLMKTKRLAKVLERVENWPPEWQDELVLIALDIEARFKGSVYQLSPEEMEGIERGLRSPLASDDEIEQAFTKLRDA